MALASYAMATDIRITSPDGMLIVDINDNNGTPTYSVIYDGKTIMAPSALGVKANYADFSSGLSITETKESSIDRHYNMTRTKASEGHFKANRNDITMTNGKGQKMTVTFCVADNDVAFRYTLHRDKGNNPKCAVIFSETTAFNFPDFTTTFICPQSKTMAGWERTKPSYEEEYIPDAPMDTTSQYKEGYTFPALFHVGDNGWALVGETGTGSNYPGCHLSDYDKGKGYTIAFPNATEMNGMGSPYAGITLPGSTPWRTITIGANLKPIVETTIPYDLVEPLYKPSQEYRPGRYTWSWLMWQDESVNYNDQMKFIDLAATMGYEYCLVDGLWDKQIGRSKIEELSRYAQSKGVRLLLWYNSNGYWNDAPQGPRHRMDTSWAREEEMSWMEKNGIAGIKVDFFGSDKQEMMKLYEDILVDANRHGLQVIFHGCTIPRGWERMYPNYVASEALLASENVRFTDHHARREAFELSMHPFSRNALGSADWGGVIMNKHMHRDNRSGHPRYTSNTFEMASAIVIQTSVNCVALCPNNLDEMQPFETDFLKELPTIWDETRYIDGYPTRYVVMARRNADRWYVAGLNATTEPLTLNLSLPMFAGKTIDYYTDMPKKKNQQLPTPSVKKLKVDSKGMAKVTIQPNGGIILKE